jgi:hypothetical protein
MKKACGPISSVPARLGIATNQKVVVRSQQSCRNSKDCLDIGWRWPSWFHFGYWWRSSLQRETTTIVAARRIIDCRVQGQPDGKSRCGDMEDLKSAPELPYFVYDGKKKKGPTAPPADIPPLREGGFPKIDLRLISIRRMGLGLKMYPHIRPPTIPVNFLLALASIRIGASFFKESFPAEARLSCSMQRSSTRIW